MLLSFWYQRMHESVSVEFMFVVTGYDKSGSWLPLVHSTIDELFVPYDSLSPKWPQYLGWSISVSEASSPGYGGKAGSGHKYGELFLGEISNHACQGPQLYRSWRAVQNLEVVVKRPLTGMFRRWTVHSNMFYPVRIELPGPYCSPWT